VDTRVLQVIFALDKNAPVYAGQQMDVFIDAGVNDETLNFPLRSLLWRAARWARPGPKWTKLSSAQTTVPDAYRQQPTTAGTNTDAALGNWWATLNDPELTSLIDRAIKSNLDLKVASSRVLEARAARRITRADLLPTVESRDSAQRVRGGLTSGLFNVNKGSSGGSNLLTPFESNVFQLGFDASWEIDFFGGRRRALEAATRTFPQSQKRGATCCSVCWRK